MTMAEDGAGGRPGLTSSQTVGPFLHLVLPWPDGPDVVPPDTPGAFWLRGRVLDGAGQPIPDAVVETWQADAQGRFDHPDDPRRAADLSPPGFRGFGRSATDDDGCWAIHTVKPGPVPGPDGAPAAPYLAVSVFARGLLDRVVTRLYFGDEAEANAADPVLSTLPVDERATLVAAPTGDGYRFDVHLQGEHETAFLVV
jgi:protocatechuate 3,4-dioxygenase alpha subunit